MMDKRLYIICGHYGSGKTNVAVNLAFHFRKSQTKVAIADLDIVNPYFRTKDSADELAAADIGLICSEYAGSNVDIPALPQDMYAITDKLDTKYILDIGGDDRGALALGRIAPKIKEENNYEMLLTVNRFRPLTRDTASVLEVIGEIEQAAKIRFTGIINNSNLGEETTADDVLSSVGYALDISKATGLPVVLTTVDERLYDAVKDKIENVFPLKLQEKIK
ncbi:MAG: hypothetical protein E7526_01180 [Ruminococcaceae bacterium]|nr:hypothetical protein [Oscillospiraceae bacterium]